MPLSITNENKNSLSISNEAKSAEGIWTEHTETWDDTGPGGNTWEAPGLIINRESKNSLSISNESKN